MDLETVGVQDDSGRSDDLYNKNSDATDRNGRGTSAGVAAEAARYVKHFHGTRRTSSRKSPRVFDQQY